MNTMLSSSLLGALLCATLACACSSEAPASASAKPEARPSGTASSAPTTNASTTASARTTPPTPIASAAPVVSPPPTMPSAVTQCEAAGSHFGAFTPSVQDILAAWQALPSEACLKKDIAADAISACAAKVGKTAIMISTDALGETPSGCQVTIQGAESGARKWIVFEQFHRDKATFFGGSTVVELLQPKPALYLAAFGGKHAELCPTTAVGGAPVKEADLPAGWAGLPEAAKAFLCSGSD
jgi:hypothetical protein